MTTFIKPYKRKRFPQNTVGESLTKQSFKQESDINFIVKKFSQTGYIDPTLQRDADYFDGTDLTFQDAMNLVVAAQNDFDALPSQIRKRFANDPSQFLDFVGDESNVDEMRKLGLLPPLPVVEPPQVTGTLTEPTGTDAATAAS